ncbi:MAG: hypothetical protein II764_07320 [Bacteroidales bacterium]|nr:hypothetical protein [Bacteroidales bacterium]
MNQKAAVFFFLLAALPSCKTVSGLIHDDDVVARVGEHELYRTELERSIPDGVPAEDSLKFAQSYIESWARDLVFLDIAEKQLSKEEKDVSRELEEYRRSLMKYRYEQRYVNERLDTNLSEKEIEGYYEAHESDFKLERPIVRARYARVVQGGEDIGLLRKKLVLKNAEDAIREDTLLLRDPAERYFDWSGRWIEAVEAARETGADVFSLLSNAGKAPVEVPDGQGFMYVVYVSEMIKAGETAPLDYCRGRICDILLSTRKHDLVVALEQDLLDDARNKEKFVVY